MTCNKAGGDIVTPVEQQFGGLAPAIVEPFAQSALSLQHSPPASKIKSVTQSTALPDQETNLLFMHAIAGLGSAEVCLPLAEQHMLATLSKPACVVAPDPKLCVA